LEYAVKMLEMPQNCLMKNLVINGKIHNDDICRLGKVLVKFHSEMPTGSRIKSFGTPKIMMKVVAENFRTLTKQVKVNPLLENKLVTFIKNNGRLFDQRIAQNKIRDIHGDLNLENIFVVKDKFYMYDRIEFNDILRYADVAHDVAHLAMDLDFYQREGLRKYFVSEYLAKSDDENLEKVLYFLMCFKASVRAKVSSFKAKYESDSTKRQSQIEESQRRLELAESYLSLF